MAGSFQPKFADLVRNYTTTIGTGDFVLGPVVNGFIGFAQACQPGDSFYYSATGIDNPAQSEVGRGTLLANGSISREPMGGTKTDFTTGTKSIALIAAAEWYAAVDAAAAASADAPSSAATRSSLADLAQSAIPALLTEPGAEGLFVWDGTDRSSDVSADGAEAMYVAPASDRTGASGAWVRKFSGFIDVKWFGAKGDANSAGSTGTDDTAAIQAALDFLSASGGGTLHFPEGNYKTAAFLIVPANVILRGAGRKISKIVGTHAGGGGADAAEDTRNGSILYNAQTINGSTRIDITVEDLWLHNANTANQGAGFYQQSGSVLTIRNCEITGSKWGVILDQTEAVRIDSCELSSGVSGGAGLWIVNGPDLNPAALGEFSNLISVRDCNANAAVSGCYGIVDDGGDDHKFDNVGFNGGVNGLRAAGVGGLVISSAYAESQSAEIIHLDVYSLSGRGVGGSGCTILGGEWLPPAGYPAIRGYDSPGSLIIIGGSYGTSSPNPLAGTANFFSVSVIGPSYSGYPGTAEFCDGSAGGHHFESLKLAMDRTGDLTLGANLSIGGASGTARFLNFQTAAATSAYIALGSDNSTLFHNVPTGGGHQLQVNSTTVATVGAAGLSLSIGALSLPPFTVATLPASPAVGARSFVTDATASTFGSAVVGGGTNKMPVYYDGAWRIG